MWIARLVGRPQSDQLQHAADRRPPLNGSSEALQAHRLGNVDAGRHARIEGGQGVLEDDLYLAAQAAARFRIGVGEILARQHDLARVGLQEMQDQAR
jgi:hypothetical protein